MSRTHEEQHRFYTELEAEFEASNQLLKQKWDAVLNQLQSNKANWDDERYFKFEKGIMEIDQGVQGMTNLIDGPIKDFLDYKFKYMSEVRK
ncbi:hypothetical protein BH09BAC1_BH09BAC1_04090 [soil metagenome]